MLEEKADVNADNKLSNNLCFNKQRRMAGDSVTIDTIINLVRLFDIMIKKLQCYFQLIYIYLI